MTQKRLVNQFIISLLFIGTYYYMYRYPLRINDASISASGYANTPLWLALGKYLLVAVLLLYVLVVKMIAYGRIKRHNLLTDVVYFYLAVIPIFYGAIQFSTIDIESGIFWLVALWLNLWFYGEKLQISRIRRFLQWAIYISIFTDFVQLLLYLLFGRLPALAFAGTISIRFGSILDDPNGFGLLIPLFLGFAIIYYTKLQKLIIIFCLALMLLATQSLTALAAAVGAAIVYGSCYFYHRPKRFILNSFLLIPIMLIFLLGIIFNFSLITETLDQFFTGKAGSISQHTDSLGQLFTLDLPTIIGLTPRGHVGESGYINYLANYGIFYLLTYAIVGVIALYRYYFIVFRAKTDLQTKAVASGIFMYLIATILANINLPLREIFPHNLYIPLFLGLASARIMQSFNLHRQTQAFIQHSNTEPIITATHAS